MLGLDTWGLQGNILFSETCLSQTQMEQNISDKSGQDTLYVPYTCQYNFTG